MKLPTSRFNGMIFRKFLGFLVKKAKQNIGLENDSTPRVLGTRTHCRCYMLVTLVILNILFVLS